MRFVLTAVAAAAVIATLAAGHAIASAPVPCAGTVSFLGPPTNLDVRAAGGNTFVEFDFTASHDLCLADGSSVTGVVSGHLVQRTSDDGDLTIRFDEVLSYGGGTLGYRGGGSLADGKWQSYVETVGVGTGPLGGIHGHGEFWPTGPTSFGDVIHYVYAP